MSLNINSEKMINSIKMPINNMNESNKSNMGPHSQDKQQQSTHENLSVKTTKQRNRETNYLSSIQRYEYEFSSIQII